MPREAPKQFQVEDAQLIFRNFEGKEGPMNRKGDRNFSVILPTDVAAEMGADGWNVRYLQPREEGDELVPYISVAVSYKNRPPRVVMVTSRARTPLDEETIETLDWADIRSADLIANAYEWNVGDKTGIKAYLKTLFVTIEEDDLERKYAINDPEG